jgi:hypothetical protein
MPRDSSGFTTHSTVPGDDDPVTREELDALARMVSALELRVDAFSVEEIERLHKLLESDARMRWLWETIRTWALWVAAVVAALTVGLDSIRAAIRRLLL